ncbi:GNAT family N-acetyltransferase [Micromonospora sp. WMMD1102]|uniref:GNAT family N-acetyltransferase n=1 Tax=Micromonospora sp. WMMD1102 TaxID=3016105 RepID=UPI0024154C8E|nr:GNAT family N-acetyltransferase [Micromonospora sp. WMMD1102]MDG4784712.1 GNAT family N-acetyltransferase [Micromonospora sp. WMMD1102]
MRQLPRIVPVESDDDVRRVARLVAEAWCEFDQAAWLVPNRLQRRMILGEVARIHIEHATFYGTVGMLADGTAATVWFDRYRPMPPPLDYWSRLADVAGGNLSRFMLLDKLLDGNRPGEGHEQLAFVAVASGFRKDGRGRRLVRQHLAKLDRAGITTYADAATTVAREFYRSLGYRPVHAIPVPDGSRICLLRRAPNTGDGTEA